MKNDELCPCASGKTFGQCCGPILNGEHKAETAVDLMRARYSAYAVGDVKFLFASSGPEVRAEFDEKTTRDWSKSAQWQGLDVTATEKGGKDDEEGEVSFVAHYAANGQKCEHREHATYRRAGKRVFASPMRRDREQRALPPRGAEDRPERPLPVRQREEVQEVLWEG